MNETRNREQWRHAFYATLEAKIIITGRNEVVAKVMFLQVCVCPQGGCLPQCMLGCQTPPGPGRHPPDQADPPWIRQTPPGSGRHPLDPPWDQADPPRPGRPPWEADSSIRSTSSWYASYWNAFLLSIVWNSLKVAKICAENLYKINKKTRMHSSRMRFARSSSHLLGVSASVHAGIHPHQGVGLEIPPPQVWAWRLPRSDLPSSPWVWAWRPPPVDIILDTRFWKYYLAQTFFYVQNLKAAFQSKLSNWKPTPFNTRSRNFLFFLK